MSDAFLEMALRAGRRLCDDAIWADRRATWLGDQKVPIDEEWEVVHRSVDGDLYGGTAGIGLFLGRLWAVTGDPELGRTALGAVAHALEWAERGHRDLSLHSGLGGVAAAAAELALLLEDEGLASAARSLSARLLDGPSGPASDLISGEAGRLLAVLSVGRDLQIPEAASAARSLGVELLDRSVKGRYPGLSWPDAAHDPPLCGLGHGASGIALALAEVALVTGEERFLEGCRQAVDYERAWYRKEHFNWPDLRELSRERLASEGSPPHPVFWCHGGVGIGLVRLRLYELTGERRFAAEAEAALHGAERALAAWVEQPTQPDLSLCHGLSAFGEFFVEAARVLDAPRFGELAVACAEIAAETVEAGWWPSGVPDGGENPSLMLGVAGTGMMFLRAARPEVPPSGLLFTRPVMSERVIVQLGEIPHQDVGRAAKELVAAIEGARVERISPRGRVLVSLTPGLSAAEVASRLERLPGVVYAEADLVDHPTGPETTS